jgi:hypothetical protein
MVPEVLGQANWVRLFGPMRYAERMQGRHLHVEGYEGKVVAVDRDSDEVVASADTPEELMRLVRTRGLRNTMILRAPRIDEPLRVGLG